MNDILSGVKLLNSFSHYGEVHNTSTTKMYVFCHGIQIRVYFLRER